MHCHFVLLFAAPVVVRRANQNGARRNDERGHCRQQALAAHRRSVEGKRRDMFDHRASNSGGPGVGGGPSGPLGLTIP